jgi:peptidoglycan/xylan/chitin deacetylase (PgdA/CDA1 family)
MIAIFIIALIVLAAYFAPQVTKRLDIRRLRALCARQRALVLTFDDGPGRLLTPALLEILRRHGAKATFFLLGVRAEKSPDLAARIVAEGHEVASHGSRHRSAWTASPWAAVRDIRDGVDALSRWLPDKFLFRPPCGKVTLPTWLALRRAGTPIGWWTVDSGDTHAHLSAPEEVIARAAGGGGCVLLLHDFDRLGPDAVKRNEFVLATVEGILDLARKSGLVVCTLGELLSMEKGPARESAPPEPSPPARTTPQAKALPPAPEPPAPPKEQPYPAKSPPTIFPRLSRRRRRADRRRSP